MKHCLLCGLMVRKFNQHTSKDKKYIIDTCIKCNYPLTFKDLEKMKEWSKENTITPYTNMNLDELEKEMLKGKKQWAKIKRKNPHLINHIPYVV